MEPAGLAIGAVGLAGLFSSCLDAIDKFDSWRNYECELRVLRLCFDTERLLLERWGRAVGFIQGQVTHEHHEALDDPHIRSQVSEHLLEIKSLCGNTDNTSIFLTRTDVGPAKHGLSSGHTQPHPNTLSESKRQKVKWTLRDKKKCTEKVECLGKLVKNLHNLVPPITSRGTQAEADRDGLKHVSNVLGNFEILPQILSNIEIELKAETQHTKNCAKALDQLLIHAGLDIHKPGAPVGLLSPSAAPPKTGPIIQPKRMPSNKLTQSGLSIKALAQFQCRYPACSCVYHLGRYLKTPTALKHYVGALLLRGTCNTYASSLWELRYWAPQWLSNFNIYALVEKRACGMPSFGLKFPRKIPWGNEDTIIRFSSLGDNDGIRSILESRKFSLDDVDPNHGRTALHYAVLRNHHSACRLLLDEGADPFFEDESGISAKQQAWEHILAKRGSPESRDGLQILFPIDDHEDFGFSALHKAILGLEGFQISQLIGLKSKVGQVNEKDTYYKRSPLHWAALRGDLEAVELLLNLEADVNAIDGIHCTPLMHAVSSATPRMVELLILRGAKVDVFNIKGETPLHYAAKYMDDLETVKTIVRARAPINQKNSLGNTPFAWAAIFNRVAMGKYLLERGADTHTTNENGDTPFRETIHQNCHGFLQLLLDYGAEYSDISRSGSSILHVLALEGDTRTVEVLSAVELNALDPHLRNNRGVTPMDVCRKRLNAPEGFKGGFWELVSSLGYNEQYEE